jgi:CspA family cold shock protein
VIHSLKSGRFGLQGQNLQCRVCGGDLFKEDMVMQEGIVKWFSEKKGCGFIRREEGKDLFVHISAINASGLKTLAERDRVSFDIEETPKGPQAKDVKTL